MRGIDVLFSLHSVSNCAPTPRVPQSARRLLNCVRGGTSCTGHYYGLSRVGTLTTSSHLIQSIAHLTFLTEHGSQVFFCGANDQQRSPNISPPSKASFQPCLIITKHGELCILSSYDVHSKRERYSPTNYARSFLILCLR